ncbi:hypothetical protein LCGC14_1599930 [marine sediment metagenome]|uniref:Uncharacterized protein n=1 Tax=marine sediment metagenome TaxID=412755 RepID=A0A0F9IBS4_9ZZZZ
MTEEVIALKLTSGEEIISRVVSRTEEIIILDRPNMIGLAAAPDGGVAIQLMPWMASNQDSEITVFTNHIVGQTKPNAELEKGYLSRTSGIALI